MLRSRLAIAILSVASFSTQAAVVVGPLSDQGYNVIMGTGGIADGGWTIGTGDNGVEVALRARERYTNNIGLQQATGTGTAANLALWNFDWSIAINNTTQTLGQYHYKLSIDTDRTSAVNYSIFLDPVIPAQNQPLFDDSFGDTGAKKGFPATASAKGHETDDAMLYTDYLDKKVGVGYDLVQNSWNMGFFIPTFDPTLNGVYSFLLQVLSETGDTVVAQTSIDVSVTGRGSPVPEPGSLALVGAALAGLAMVRRRKVR